MVTTPPEEGALKFYHVAAALLAAVQAALVPALDSTARIGVVPGAIAWDDCACGALYVSLGPVHLSDDFPNQETAVVGPCSAAWEVCEIMIQVLRCAPTAATNTQSLAPSVAANDAAAQLLAADGFNLLNAVANEMCQERAGNEIIEFLIGSVVPLGPEGGCMGQELTVLVGMPRG